MSKRNFAGLTFLHGPTVIYAEEPIASNDAIRRTLSAATMTSASPEHRLNQIVKGAPTTNISASPIPPPLQYLGKQSSDAQQSSLDPHLSTLPSAPPQIYLNLLILESSLRAQYLHLVSRRRLNTFFLLLLAAWNGLFFYALFLRPREDGTGLGGSVYWVIETGEKLALMGGVVTVLLVWGTGQWERGIRWPRKWLGTTNRGLRTFNLRVVITKKRFVREMLGHLSFLLPFGLWREAGGSDWHLVEHEMGIIVEEDLAKGGDGIMLLLLPKSFSPEFRENWEEYRTEYWDKENERRAGLRRKLHTQRRTKAKEAGGWKWWTGAWRLQSTRHNHQRKHQDLEKHPLGHHLHGSSHRASLSEKHNHTRSLSRQSSRSSTPHLEFDGTTERPLSERMRRGSSVSSTASVRRKPTRDRKDGTPTGSPLLSPLTSTSLSMSGTAEDEREERRKRRKEREAAKKERQVQAEGQIREGEPGAHRHHQADHQHQHKGKSKSKSKLKEHLEEGTDETESNQAQATAAGYDAGESSVPTTPMNNGHGPEREAFSLDVASPAAYEDGTIKAEL
ncbi:hypothetical protein A1O7_09952 [Cladophialophora yegresii CBS 114405]|uniref:Spo7-like protein n=1 Tax=Cladophialophora yegresii CBS 114405 TaxID=1182544 RepID=W9VR20_9EURO|nr:uncharacterized protein A1O7_09952 [Cladophialophora yegresii CBS 114405]EXJ54611.1 hypothetical protein A1O7_09952 [Cladophialophora yegresii CBS 114405]